MSTLQRNEDGRTELTVEVGREAFQKAVDASYRKNIRKMNVPGFRRGKAPRKVAETIYGPSVFYEDAVDALIPGAYRQAVEEHGLDVVGRPEMDLKEINESGFTFTAAQHLRPEAALRQYKGLSAPKTVLPVTDGDVDAELERLRERNARIEALDGPLCMGDTAYIDFEGFVDGVAFPGGKAANHKLELGAGQFIPGFEEQLAGAAAGDSLEVKVTFPAEYHAPELAGKDAVFNVKINEAKRSVKPDLDDEFAQDVSECDTLDEFKADIRRRFETVREREAEQEYELALTEKLLEGFECEIPDVMVDEQLETILQDFNYRLSLQGLNLSQYLMFSGQSFEDLENAQRENAKKQVMCQLAFLAISKAEGLAVSDDELTAEYEKLAESYKMPMEKVRASVSEKTLRRDMLALKGSEFLRANAAPPVVTAAPEAPAAGPDTAENGDGKGTGKDTAESKKAAKSAPKKAAAPKTPKA